MTQSSTTYQESGYALVRGLIPHALIDDVLEEYRRTILPSPQPLLRQPLFARPEGHYAYKAPHSFDEWGHMKEPLKEVQVLTEYPVFSAGCMRILCGPEVQGVLAELTGRAEFLMHQTMFFDLNTGTEPHQDAYYIDSNPRGRLIGAWIAMEDIHEDAGRFFIMPGSQKVDLGVGQDPLPDPRAYLARSKEYFTAHPDAVFTPDLRKGDVLFWNSNVVHGSHPTRDPRHSRKSLTAHYTSSDVEGRNAFRVFKNLVTRRFLGMEYVLTNRPDGQTYRVVDLGSSTVPVDGKPVTFLRLRLGTGETVTVRLDPAADRQAIQDLSRITKELLSGP